MENQTYQACLEQVKRIDASLTSLDQLVIIDREFTSGIMSYDEAISRIFALRENPQLGTRIPIKIEQEIQKQIQVQPQ